jgi:hypothetical protein
MNNGIMFIPPTDSSWNQIVQELEKIFKFKDLALVSQNV